jgi:ornithine cyclodeaminase
MLFLNKNDIYNAISMRDAISATKECFATLKDDNFDMPSRSLINMPEKDGLFVFMPAYLKQLNAAGIKVGSIYKGNNAIGLPTIHAIVVLFDAMSGQVKALLDGETITLLKTASVSAVATEILSKKEAKNLSIIGAGAQARAQLEGICCVRDIEKLYIYSRTLDSSNKFQNWILESSKYKSLDIVVCDSVNKSVENADIICTVTSSDSIIPIVKEEDLAAFVHINAIGGSTYDACELDPRIFRNATTVVELKSAALNEAGEIRQGIKTNLIEKKDLLEISDILNRKNFTSKPITVFKSVGIAAQDMAIADKIFQNAVSMKIGSNIAW